MTDDELLEAQLVIDDPFNQAGLKTTLPEGAEVADILNIYNYKGYPQRKVHCAVCGSARHRMGFTLKLANGDLVLVGSSCGAEIAHESWAQHQKALKGQQDRQYYLRVLSRVRDIDPTVLRMLRAFERNFDQISRLHTRFQRTMPDVYELLRQRCLVGQPMLEIKVFRENKVQELSSSGNRQSARFVEETTFRHRLQGIQFFQYADPLSEFEHAVSSVEALLNLAQGTTGHSTATFRRHFKAMRGALGKIGRLIEAYNSVQDLFAAENLTGIADWMKRSDYKNGEYWVEEGALWWDGGRDGDAGKMHWPPPYHRMEPVALTALTTMMSLPRLVIVEE